MIRVGVVGLGKMGLAHTAILSTIPDARVVALADSDRRLGAAVRSMGLRQPFYTSAEEMLDRETLDAGFVCTPTFTHFDLVQLCLSRNLHVFVEKPMTIRYEQSKLVANSMKGRRLVTGAGYFFAYRRTFRYAGELLRQGMIGTPRAFRGVVQHTEVLSPKKGWPFNPRLSGGGVVTNLTSHLLFLLSDYFGQPRAVSADLRQIHSSSVEDEATIRLRYEHGLEGVVESSWCVPGKPILEITLSVEGNHGVLTVGHREIRIELSQARLNFPPGHHRIHESDIPSKPTIDLNPDAGGEAYYLQDLDFISACKNGAAIRNSFEAALRAEQVLDAIYRSAQERATITLENA